MNKTLIALYDRFYTPPEMAQTKGAIEEAHQLLIERLEKPERKLVLKIIDGKDRIAEDLSEDSFISGFLLAWTLASSPNCLIEKSVRYSFRSSFATFSETLSSLHTAAMRVSSSSFSASKQA